MKSWLWPEAGAVARHTLAILALDSRRILWEQRGRRLGLRDAPDASSSNIKAEMHFARRFGNRCDKLDLKPIRGEINDLAAFPIRPEAIRWPPVKSTIDCQFGGCVTASG